MNNLKKKICYTAHILALLTSCKYDNNPNPRDPGGGDQELITKVTLRLTNASDTTQHVTASFSDPEGEGVGAGPTTDSLKLKDGVTYYSYLEILDETKNPIVNTSNKIMEEANYHRFHYTFTASSSTGVNVGITITDTDERTPPLPLGLKSTFHIGTAIGLGSLNINLRHFADGETKTDNPSDGETDMYIDFPVRIY